jgi:hypothetical protein
MLVSKRNNSLTDALWQRDEQLAAMKVEAERKDAENTALRADVKAAREMLIWVQEWCAFDGCQGCDKVGSCEECEMSTLIRGLERWA